VAIPMIAVVGRCGSPKAARLCPASWYRVTFAEQRQNLICLMILSGFYSDVVQGSMRIL
jgi:hypothetical protein